MTRDERLRLIADTEVAAHELRELADRLVVAAQAAEATTGRPALSDRSANTQALARRARYAAQAARSAAFGLLQGARTEHSLIARTTQQEA